jgi:multicomponent Na+:H+ antiporter subunit G
MHAAGKAGTLGIILVILSAVVHFAPDGASVPVRGLLAIWFQMLTTPAATHLLARAAYVEGYPQTALTVIDELEVYLGSYVRDHRGKE